MKLKSTLLIALASTLLSVSIFPKNYVLPAGSGKIVLPNGLTYRVKDLNKVKFTQDSVIEKLWDSNLVVGSTIIAVLSGTTIYILSKKAYRNKLNKLKNQVLRTLRIQQN